MDTVAFVGPTTDALLYSLREQHIDRATNWDTGEFNDKERYSSMWHNVGLASGRLFGFRQEGEPRLRVELSLPTMLRGHNRDALDLDLLPDAVAAALILLSDDLPDIPQLDVIRFQRVDLTRDLDGVQSTHSVLDALSKRHLAYARVNDPRYKDDGSGRLQSVTKGTRDQYLVRGYDKAYELRERARKRGDRRELLSAWAKASEGRLRFELQLRARRLRKMGMVTLTDMNTTTLNTVAREHFERAHWSEPYGGRGRIQQSMLELEATLSAAAFRNLCVYLFCTEKGMEVRLSRHSVDQVRPIARRHNLLDPEDDGPRRRLDFDLGREVHVE